MAQSEGMIENKIKQQDKLVTIDLEKHRDNTPIDVIDLKDYLFKGLILKEKEFRSALDEYDWSQHDQHYVTVFCSTDAIIAPWAYMLITQHAQEYAKQIFLGTKEEALEKVYRRSLKTIDWSQYQDKFVLLKGCSKEKVPESVYVMATQQLLPYVQKLMYGEACSSVPVYRKVRSSRSG